MNFIRIKTKEVKEEINEFSLTSLHVYKANDNYKLQKSLLKSLIKKLYKKICE